MNVAWPPGSRKGCGHAPCRRYTIASSVALLVADGGLIGIGATPAGMAHPALLVAAACVIAATGIVLALWPHRGGTGTAGSGDDVIGLFDVARECRCCSPEDHGPCTCTRPCKNIRCTAGLDALGATPPIWRSGRVTVPDHVPAEWTRENT